MIDEKKLIKAFDENNMFLPEVVEKLINDQPKVDEWIPCNKQMPEMSDWYIITVGKSRCVYADYYDKEHNEWQDYCNSDVLAWKPMPEPYMDRED